jgi:hypothetical protein
MRSIRRATQRAASFTAAIASVFLLATCDLDKIVNVDSTTVPQLDSTDLVLALSGGPDLTLGGTSTASVTATPASGVDLDAAVVEFASNDATTISIVKETGVMTGLKLGTAKITARVLAPELGAGVTHSKLVRVRFKGIKVVTPVATDSIDGLGYTRTVAVQGVNFTNGLVPGSVTADSLRVRVGGVFDTSLIRISGTTLTAKKNGTSYVVAIFDGFKDSVAVKVRQVAKSVTFPTTDYTARHLNYNMTVPVILKDKNDSTIPTAALVTWKTKDTTKATIGAATGVVRVKSLLGDSLWAKMDGIETGQKIVVAQVVGTLQKFAGDAQTDTVALPVAIPPTVTAVDSGNTIVVGASVTFKRGTGLNALITDSVKTTDANGRATLGSWKLGDVAGISANSVVATVAGSAATTTFTATSVAGEPRQLGFIVEPSTTPVGASISPAVKVAVLDSLGNVNTAATHSITLSIDSAAGFGTAPALAGAVTVAAVSGVATFSNLSVTEAASYIALRATAAGVADTVSAPFGVFGAPVQLVFESQPLGTSAGAPLAPVTVRVTDAVFGTVPTATDSITVSVSSGPGTVSGTFGKRAVAGVATFDNLRLSAAGVYVLQAAAASRTSALSDDFVMQGVGSAAKLVFTVQPPNVAAGGTISPSIKVAVQDANGASITNSTQAITLSIDPAANPGGSAIQGTTTRAAVSGEATFNDIVLTKVGSGYRLVASASGTTINSASSATFNVTPGASFKLAFAQGPTHVVSGSSMAPAVTVAIQDVNSNVVPSVAATAVTLSASGTGCSSANVSGLGPVNTVSGVATFSIATSAQFTTCTLSASASGFSSVPSTAFNSVSATGAVRVKFTTQPAASGTAGSTMSTGTVAFQNASGTSATAASSTNISVSVLSGPSSAISGTTSFATTTSTAFSNSFVTAGTYRLLATATGYKPDTSAAFIVAPGSPNRVNFITQPNTIGAGVPFSTTIAAAIQDNLGNVVTTATNNIQLSAFTTTPSFQSLTLNNGALNRTVAAVNGVATFTNLSVYTAAQLARLQVSAPSTSLTTNSSNQFDVAIGPPSRTKFVTAPASATVGSVINSFQVAAADSVNNTTTSYPGSILGVFLDDYLGSLSGTTQQAPSAGVATFTGLTTNAAGTFALGAFGPGLVTSYSSTFPSTYTGTTLLTSRASDPWDLAISGSTLVWGESDAIVKSSTTGSGVTVLSSGWTGSPYAVVTDGTDVFFIVDDGTLRKVPLAGGITTTLVTDIAAPRPHLEIDGGFVYFVDGTSLRRVSMVQNPTVSVGSTTSLYTVDGSGFGSSFELSGTTLFFRDAAGISKGNSDGIGGVTTLVSSSDVGYDVSMVESGGTLYFTDWNWTLQAVPTSGGVPSSVTEAGVPNGRLMSDGVSLFTSSTQGVGRITLSNGAATWINRAHSVWGAVIDGSFVYWARYNFGGGNATEVYRAPQ